MKPTATVWPGREAASRHLAAAAAQSPGGLIWEPPVYTMDNFLPLVLEGLPGLSGTRRSIQEQMMKSCCGNACCPLHHFLSMNILKIKWICFLFL